MILPTVRIAGFYGNLKTQSVSPYLLCICEHFYRKCTTFPRQTEIKGRENNEMKKRRESYSSEYDVIWHQITLQFCKCEFGRYDRGIDDDQTLRCATPCRMFCYLPKLFIQKTTSIANFTLIIDDRLLVTNKRRSDSTEQKSLPRSSANYSVIISSFFCLCICI